MVLPHASRARVMALARPRGELGHIRPKLPSCMLARALLLVRPHGRVRVMALVHPRPSTWCSRMDKKGKAKCPVCKMYASQAAARNEATSKPPAAPKAPVEPKKKPIFIDLTVDSESKDTTRASSETHFSSVASCS
ncbi:hypothetical protein PIB30_009577 [Stylosanthes scabra]|uniref:Uncharacterized protein n=1 Tax=Stylosanthes scabra TaxID=79078 RepID=A0ABU6Q5E9_9FABA|nr:hypothetical protein [Stylosanthes scabra]